MRYINGLFHIPLPPKPPAPPLSKAKVAISLLPNPFWSGIM
jgi:hypothetical protein